MAKVVFITGASSGIGKAIGEYLHSKNYKVYGTSRTPEKYPDIPFPLLVLDVTDTDSIAQALDEVISKEGKLDVLINNAGVGMTGPVEETPEGEIKSLFETNFYGPIRLIQMVLPQMRKQGSGLVINITSIAGYMGLPFRGFYSASKAALEITTEALRMEAKSFGVEFTNLAPGDFATNIASRRYHAPLKEDSPYKNSYKKTLELMDKHVDSGNNPMEVARKIHEIIESEKPNIHYKVGDFLQKFSVVMKRVLPDKVYERILMKHYQLK